MYESCSASKCSSQTSQSNVAAKHSETLIKCTRCGTCDCKQYNTCFTCKKPFCIYCCKEFNKEVSSKLWPRCPCSKECNDNYEKMITRTPFQKCNFSPYGGWLKY